MANLPWSRGEKQLTRRAATTTYRSPHTRLAFCQHFSQLFLSCIIPPPPPLLAFNEKHLCQQRCFCMRYLATDRRIIRHSNRVRGRHNIVRN
jgi:hypothetical protein